MSTVEELMEGLRNNRKLIATKCDVIRHILKCECGGEVRAILTSPWRKSEVARWESICHGTCGKVTYEARVYPYYEYAPVSGTEQVRPAPASLPAEE